MHGTIIDGYVYGNGSAIDMEVGFYPDRVTITNLTDGDVITDAYMAFVAAFTSGGTAQPVPGDVLVGATSGAYARVRRMIALATTWSAGTATGSIIFNRDSMVGTFTGGELLYVRGNALASVDDLTLTAAPAVICTATSTAVATVTTTSAISHYIGSNALSKGFTIGSVISEANKLLHWEARRVDQ